jgi:hypothetical protein
VDAAISAITDELGAAPLDILAEVHGRLAQLLGDEFETAVRVRSLVDGELVLEVSNTRAAGDLGYRRDELAKSLALPPLQGAIRRVRVVVQRVG